MSSEQLVITCDHKTTINFGRCMSYPLRPPVCKNFVPEDNRKINNKNNDPNKLIIAKKSK